MLRQTKFKKLNSSYYLSYLTKPIISMQQSYQDISKSNFINTSTYCFMYNLVTFHNIWYTCYTNKIWISTNKKTFFCNCFYVVKQYLPTEIQDKIILSNMKYMESVNDLRLNPKKISINIKTTQNIPLKSLSH